MCCRDYKCFIAALLSRSSLNFKSSRSTSAFLNRPRFSCNKSRHFRRPTGGCVVWCGCWWFCPSRSSAGAGRTGTFIALSNILERVKAEGLLDVFQTVKSLRMQRPHMVQTVVGGKQDNIKPAVQKLSAYSRLCCLEPFLHTYAQ